MPRSRRAGPRVFEVARIGVGSCGASASEPCVRLAASGGVLWHRGALIQALVWAIARCAVRFMLELADPVICHGGVLRSVARSAAAPQLSAVNCAPEIRRRDSAKRICPFGVTVSLRRMARGFCLSVVTNHAPLDLVFEVLNFGE